MGNVTKHFLTTLFSMTLFIFVLINVLGWSGMDLGGLIGGTDTYWSAEGSYFGFNSLIGMIRSFDSDILVNLKCRPIDIYDSLRKTINYMLGNLPSLIDEFTKLLQVFNEGIKGDYIRQAVVLLQNLGLCIVSGLLCIVYAFLTLFRIVAFLSYFITTLFLGISGAFNSTFADSPILTYVYLV